MEDFPIISLTSYGKRLLYIHRVCIDMIKQPIKKIVLTVYKDDLRYLVSNGEMMQLIQKGYVEVILSHFNLKNHLKYYVTMNQYPNDIIITIDDDRIYPKDFVDILMSSHRKMPECVISNCCVFFDPHKEIIHFRYTDRVFDTNSHKDAMAEGFAGILYPPNFGKNLQKYYPLIKSDNAILKNDDIFLHYYELNEGYEVCFTGHPITYREIRDVIDAETQSSKTNYIKGGDAEKCRQLLFELQAHS